MLSTLVKRAERHHAGATVNYCRSRRLAALRGAAYSNATLIQLLRITAAEQRELRTIIGADERRRRNAERHQRAPPGRRRRPPGCFNLATSFDRREKARKLATTGMTQREIAAELGVSVGAVNGYLVVEQAKDVQSPSPGPHGASSAQRSTRVRTPRSARTQQTSNVPTLKTPVTCACEATQDGAAIARFPRLARGEAPLSSLSRSRDARWQTATHMAQCGDTLAAMRSCGAAVPGGAALRVGVFPPFRRRHNRPTSRISNQTRHKSLDMKKRYTRPTTIFDDNAAYEVGL